MNPYERSSLRLLTGDALRPGGRALTLRGLELCSFRPGSLILDVGCGPGASLKLLSERHFPCLGLDCSIPLLHEARAHAPVVQADFSRLPLPDASVDGILCECVLSLAPHPSDVLAECFRTLSPGGRLLLSDLFLHSPSAKPTASLCGAKPLPLRELAHLLRARGFSPSHMEDHSRLLRELAARAVWELGSLSALNELLGCLPESGDGRSPDSGNAIGKQFGYVLIIAEKRSFS